MRLFAHLTFRLNFDFNFLFLPPLTITYVSETIEALSCKPFIFRKLI